MESGTKNTKRSNAVRAAINRNRALAKKFGITKKNKGGNEIGDEVAYRHIRKVVENKYNKYKQESKKNKPASASATKKNKRSVAPKSANVKTKTPVAPTFNPFNDNIFGSASSSVPANAMKSAAELFGTASKGKKTNEQKAKMSNSMKKSQKTLNRFARIAEYRAANPGVSQANAMKAVAKINANAKKAANNANLLGLNKLSISNAKPANAAVNQLPTNLYGM